MIDGSGWTRKRLGVTKERVLAHIRRSRKAMWLLGKEPPNKGEATPSTQDEGAGRGGDP